MPIIDKKTQKMFDSVTDDIIKDGQKQTQNISTAGGFAHRYEEPLKDKHPGLDLALMYAQPGNILAKLMAPSMAKGTVYGLMNGEGMMAVGPSLKNAAFAGIENLEKGNIGRSGERYNAGKRLLDTERESGRVYKSVKATTSGPSEKIQKFMQLSQQEQNNIVKYWNGENFSSLWQLQRAPKEYRKFLKWIETHKQGGILKAQDGTFEGFWNTLPQNQQDSTDFNVRRYWELNGKPVNFKEAIKRGMYKKEKDGYHANSIAFNEETGEYEFMKSPNHPTIQYELNWFNSNKANKFRNKYQLDSTSIPWKYVPKGQDGIGRSIWQQISSPQQTYIDGYGTERPVSESKAITVGRNVYNTLGNFFNGKDRDLSDTEYQEKYGYGKPIGEVGVIGLVGNTGVKFAKYFNEAELNNIAIQASKNWTKLNNNQRSLIKRFFRYINEGRKYTEDSKMAKRGYRQSVDAIKKIINSVNLEKPINTIKTTKPVVKNTTTHSKELQKIVDSSFEPFDEMSTLWETGSKAKTTSGFRLSDWKNGGVLKGQAGMVLGSALLSRSDTVKNISDNIRQWGTNLKNHINTINRYNPEQVPVIGRPGVTTVRRAKIGPLVSARGKDPKIVENGGEV